MLVIVMKNQLLQPATVCQSCPMASQSGLPRWQHGRLRCGRPVTQALDAGSSQSPQNPSAQNPSAQNQDTQNQRPQQYECAMGFRVAELSDSPLDP